MKRKNDLENDQASFAKKYISSKKIRPWRILCHFGGIQKFYFFFFENFEFSSYYKKLNLNRSFYNLELMTLITA